MRLQVLTPGFTTPNGRAFLFPLVVHRKALAARGIEIRFVRDSAKAGKADVVIVDSKFHRARWRRERDGVLAELSGLKGRSGRLLYFDTGDGSGWLQTDALALADGYFKAQVLRDRRRYLEPIYAHRPYADYYHREFGVNDAEPEYSSPVPDPALLEKIRVSWNSGLADYSPLGPARMALYHRLPFRPLLRFPAPLARPSRPRPNPVSCRFGVDYERQSVAWQRRRMRSLLGRRFDTVKLARPAYFRELAASKLVVSPFGLGEITLKDFETFLAGGILLKPDMTHLETWPDFFRAGETMAAHRWDLADLEARIDEILDGYPHWQTLAEAGQETYRRFTSGPEAAGLFADRLAQILSPQGPA